MVMIIKGTHIRNWWGGGLCVKIDTHLAVHGQGIHQYMVKEPLLQKQYPKLARNMLTSLCYCLDALNSQLKMKCWSQS